jgi:Zn-dependent protease
MQYMGIYGIEINVILMVLNLIPLPPLDGGRVAVGLLPGPLAWQLARIEPFGFFILLALLATGVLSVIIGPPINGIEHLIMKLVGLG